MTSLDRLEKAGAELTQSFLPVAWEAAVVVIVFQSLVELFGMTAYLWAVPRVVAPDPDEVGTSTGPKR